MTSFLAAAYPWLKSLHIIAVIAWMVGLLYLPRLYVYHAEAPAGSNRAAMLATMERRLLRGIMLPAAAMSYAFGLPLACVPGVVDWRSGWIWSKLTLVLLLTILHMAMAKWRRGFAEGRYPHTPGFLRAANEIPTLIMIGIVLLVVFKPF